MQKSIKHTLALIILGVIINSCSVIQPNRMFKIDDSVKFQPFDTAQKEYRIQPYDKLSISITSNDGFKLISIGDNANNSSRQNTKMEVEYLVEYDGFSKLPTIGRVQLQGKTLREAEMFLEQQYGKFYKNPFVLLRVTNRKVYIFKNGGEQGSVLNIPEDRLTLIEALAISGGLNPSDKAFKIRLIRGDISKSPQIYNYNISNLKDIKGSNLLLQANDIIYIESRPRYIRKVLSELTPYLTLLSTVILIYKLF